MNNAGPGSRKPSLRVNFFSCSGLQLLAGPYGQPRIGRALKKIQIKHPYELIFSASLYMRYWTGLYAMVDQVMIRDGVETMMKITMELLKKSQKTLVPRRITQGDEARITEMDSEEDGIQQTSPDVL
jgi:hypothetical protein